MHRGDDPAHGINREYATDLFTDEAIRIIENHELPRPLYLQISHLAVHAPLEQPVDEYHDKEFSQIREPNRRKYASTHNLWATQFCNSLSTSNFMLDELIRR